MALHPMCSKRLFAAKKWSEEEPVGGLYMVDEDAEGWKKVKAGITSISEVLRVSHAVGSGKQANEKK